MGFSKTLSELANKQNWPHMKSTLWQYVRLCTVYQRTQAQNLQPFGLFQRTKLPVSMMAHLSVHFTIPPPKFHKWARQAHGYCQSTLQNDQIHTLPKRLDAIKNAQRFKNYVYRHRESPLVIVFRQNRILMSKFWNELFRLFWTKLSSSSAYHAKTDGPTEIGNEKVEEMICASVNFDKSNSDKKSLTLKSLTSLPSTAPLVALPSFPSMTLTKERLQSKHWHHRILLRQTLWRAFHSRWLLLMTTSRKETKPWPSMPTKRQTSRGLQKEMRCGFLSSICLWKTVLKIESFNQSFVDFSHLLKGKRIHPQNKFTPSHAGPQSAKCVLH